MLVVRLERFTFGTILWASPLEEATHIEAVGDESEEKTAANCGKEAHLQRDPHLFWFAGYHCRGDGV